MVKLKRTGKAPTNRKPTNLGNPVAPDDSNAKAYTATLLSEAREELNRADSKASILVASTGVAVGALLAGLIAGNWSPFMLPNLIEWVWWFGSATVLGGITCIAMVIYPRTRRPGKVTVKTVAYYGDAIEFATRDGLKQAVVASADLSLDRLVDQVYNVSRIVARKYTYLKWGLRFLASGTVLISCSLLLQPLCH